MTDHQIRRYDMCERVDAFGQENAADFAEGSVAKAKFAVIAAIIKQLASARAGQHPSPDRGREALLDAIRADVLNITRTASAIALEEPGFQEKFRPPENSNAREVVLAAEKILEVLWPAETDDAVAKDAKLALVAKFVAHELPADFVAHLKGDVDALTKDRTEHDILREDGAGDTKLIEKLIKDAMAAATVLDAIVHNKYGSQPEKIGAWHMARHVEADPKRKKNEPPTPPTPTP